MKTTFPSDELVHHDVPSLGDHDATRNVGDHLGELHEWLLHARPEEENLGERQEQDLRDPRAITSARPVKDTSPFGK